MLAILGGVVLVLAFILMQTCFDWSSNSFPLELLDDGSGNEALIIEGTVCGERVLFMIDTAYAGAPVLSVSYMNAIRKDRRLASSGNVKLRFMKTMDALEKRMTNHEMHETLNEYVVEAYAERSHQDAPCDSWESERRAKLRRKCCFVLRSFSLDEKSGTGMPTFS